MIDGIDIITVDDVLKVWENDSILTSCPPGRLEKVKNGEIGWYLAGVDELRILRLQWKIDRLKAEANFCSPSPSLTNIIQRWVKIHQTRERALHPRDWMVWADQRYPGRSGGKNAQVDNIFKGLRIENKWWYAYKLN